MSPKTRIASSSAAFAGTTEQVERQRQGQLHAPGQAHGFEQPGVRSTTGSTDADLLRDQAFGELVAGLGHLVERAVVVVRTHDVLLAGARHQFQIEDTFVARTHQRQQAVRGNLPIGSAWSK